MNRLLLSRLMRLPADFEQPAYCEGFLRDHFGASGVDSIDNSDYEQASIIHDMNQPLPDGLRGKYDTVLDLGCIEHVYNAPQALANCSALLRPGGQVVHVLPANNYCGHGFWQFSPELFFSLYSPENGYRDTEVFLADYPDKWRWWQVREPRGSERVNVMSSSELYVLVRGVKADVAVSHARVQQSDYLHEWEHSKPVVRPMAVPGGAKGALMRLGWLYDRLFPLFHRLARLRRAGRLTTANPGLIRFDVR